MNEIKFQDRNGTFRIENPENYSGLYLPLAGEEGIKSCVTPNLGGDSKIDKNHFLTEPVSIENLHNNKNTRNFWFRIEGRGIWSACGSSAEQEYHKFSENQDNSVLEAGLMWQKLTRTSDKYGLKAEITSFVLVDGKQEVMLVKVENISKEELTVVPIAAVPIYGRSADNLRDHRHVTSLLHRIETIDNGVVVTPTLSFDERGHKKNTYSYYVCGSDESGNIPERFYPTVEAFIGEGGSFLNPQAVREDSKGTLPGTIIEGKEAVGGMRFKTITLQPEEHTSFIVITGATENKQDIKQKTAEVTTADKVETLLEKTKTHWIEKVNVSFETEDKKTDNYLKWICFQPILRRIYGCSFLPHHDYGKGGRGWRDLWQDCLALLIMDPSQVRQMIIDNYQGVRMDGTNATIIGEKQGEFVADRNNITRVWMDHAFWPFLTTNLYLNQTGDYDILWENIPYFKDPQIRRGTDHDTSWKAEDGNCQKTIDRKNYLGSVLEHILVQNLCAFYDVGEHNQLRLHGADWNDALDMAWEKGESVAFTCAYAGNLQELANVLTELTYDTKDYQIELAEELRVLLGENEKLYESVEEKHEILEIYTKLCETNISGRTIQVPATEVIRNLRQKSNWLMKNIQKQEWICDNKGNGWFNGYYDNHGNQVEGIVDDKVRMMLTSQVFSIMSGTASEDQIRQICKSADTYLYDKSAGGYRLNTNFEEEKYDLGRMFGFAYGEKENGAVFSHMTVMYANALYKRGFVEEGYKVIQTLLETAMDFEKSKMYPGLPEYFDTKGRGLYSYLTGAASWFMLTMITEVYGVHGKSGNLVLQPKLLANQFDDKKQASISLEFAGKKFLIQYVNENVKTYGKYIISKAICDSEELTGAYEDRVIIPTTYLKELSEEAAHEITVYLV